MNYSDSILFSCNSKKDLLKVLRISEDEIDTAIKQGYSTYPKQKNGKTRFINEPNETLLKILRKINFELQKLDKPLYATSGWVKQSCCNNVILHKDNPFVITMDIANYFPNTRSYYIEKFFDENLKIKGEALNILLKPVTYNNCLPTGAPTSTILSYFAHKDIFDSIHRCMQKNSIQFTLYVDDITLSSKKFIGKWVVKHIKNSLQAHSLFIKSSKTKFYGYRGAKINGLFINQNRQISTPWKLGHSVVKKLEQKNLKEMNKTELQKLLGKIAYIQQLHPKQFVATKHKIIKQLKILERKNYAEKHK